MASMVGLAGCGMLSPPFDAESSGDAPGIFSENAALVTTMKYPGGIQVAIERTSGVNGLPQMKAFTVTGEALTGFFSAGSYLIDRSRMGANDRQFATQAKNFADKLVQGMDAEHQSLRVKATYTGSTDSSLIRSNLIYGGEFGHVEQSFPLGLQTMTIRLDAGSRITNNEELALLRAYNLRAAFEDFMPRELMQDAQRFYSIEVGRGSGARFRYASVRVELVPRASSPAS